MTAAECQAAGLVSRVLPAQDLERETRAFARRVAGNHPFTLRVTKLQISKAQDAQGFRSLLEDSLGDYAAMMFMPGVSTIAEDKSACAPSASPSAAGEASATARTAPAPHLTDGRKQADPPIARISSPASAIRASSLCCLG